jgi:ribose transport system permease protein
MVGFAGVFIVMAAAFAIRSPEFLGVSNLVNVIFGAVTLLLVSLALTLVIAAGGIDLSLGTSLDFGAWVVIVVMLHLHLSWGMALLVAMIAGMAVGAVNAVLVTKFKVSPFLATLGVYFVGRSIQQIGTNGGATQNFREAPAAFHEFGVGSLGGMPYRVLIAVALAGLLWFLLAKTVFGRRVGAIGLQPQVAWHSGIPVNRYLTWVFVLAGGVSALAGVLLTAQIRIYTPLAGFSYLTDAIAAVLLGAALHPRGRPSVPGTVAAVLFLEVLANGLDLWGIDFNVKVLVRGIALVVVLAAAFGLRRWSGPTWRPRVSVEA